MGMYVKSVKRKREKRMTVEPIRKDIHVKKMIKILEKQNSRNALVFRMGLNTILRIGDILKLKANSVVDEDGNIREYLVTQENKTNKCKKIKLTSLIREEIANYITEYDLQYNDHLFFSFRDPNKPIDRTVAWKFLKSASKKVGIPNFGTHSMRKTLAFTIYDKTKDINLVMRMLNHTNPSYTLRYIGVTQEMIDDTYQEFAI